ncbi:MAG TPA: YdcF family protein [Candidatus Saccharimonadales bacterium]|jgi:uncharacterized SAM-binding protein YcdF (DUF218 family)
MKLGLVVLFGLLIAIIGVGTYLKPNDLKNCPSPSSGECAPADAIIVVSGGDTAARTDHAIALYQNGWGRYIVLSGAAADPDAPSNASAMGKRAVAAGVPADAILVEEDARTTTENADNVVASLTERQVSRVIVTTSAYHQRRVQLEFSRAFGPSVVVLSAPLKNDKQWAGHFWWLTLRGWWLALGELTKIVAFYIAGSAR